MCCAFGMAALLLLLACDCGLALARAGRAAAAAAIVIGAAEAEGDPRSAAPVLAGAAAAVEAECADCDMEPKQTTGRSEPATENRTDDTNNGAPGWSDDGGDRVEETPRGSNRALWRRCKETQTD